ncbi:MAG: sugar phosphate isomerase/epimerase [Desulfobacterales bacterium]|nr:sugar phosphate isomerase/epimerase [Desulfobacterales bacterium]
MKPRRFRLGTTSFIYPDFIIPNVKKIGRFFDEIELLVFESQPDEVVPSKADVAELKTLGEDLDLTYNIHLPVDVSLTHESEGERRKAADTLLKVIDRFAPLAPTTHTLHLDMDKSLSGKEEIKAWEDRATHGLDLVAPDLEDPSRISVETLWYPPKHFAQIVNAFGLSVCADIGHHVKYGYDINETFDLFDSKVSLIHLHGVDTALDPPKDHIGLDRMPSDIFDAVSQVLKNYTGTVSLEVFNLSNLESSLSALGKVFTNIPKMS